MARYIDADALKLDIDLSKGASVLDMALSVLKAVKEAPTADVVPKSEVERLEKEVDRLSQVVLYHDAFKADEIRDIFEDIEGIFKKRIDFYTDMKNKSALFTVEKYTENMITNCNIYLQDIAELKKKYTEGAVNADGCEQ